MDQLKDWNILRTTVAANWSLYSCNNSQRVETVINLVCCKNAKCCRHFRFSFTSVESMYLLAKWCASSHIPAALYISMAWFQNNKKDFSVQCSVFNLIKHCKAREQNSLFYSGMAEATNSFLESTKWKLKHFNGSSNFQRSHGLACGVQVQFLLFPNLFKVVRKRLRACQVPVHSNKIKLTMLCCLG